MTEQFTFGGEIVWRPTEEYIERAHLTAFMRVHGIGDFNELMARSTEDVVWFTNAVLKYLDIQFYEPYSKVIDVSEGIQFPRWCVDGKMNIVHNCLDKYVATESHTCPGGRRQGRRGKKEKALSLRDSVAVLWEGKKGQRNH